MTSAVAVAALLAVAGPVLPAGSQEATPPVAYTSVATSQAGCDLHNVDLSTGELTDLPAGPSLDACVADLAVAPDGTVWGLVGISVLDGPVAAPAAPLDGVDLVRFDASGAPTATRITAGDAELFLATGGLAVDAAGTVYAQMTVAPPRATVDATAAPAADLADCYSTLCLFEIDPTTAQASVIGPSGLFSSIFEDLAVCGATMWSLGEPDGAAMQEVDPSSGAIDPSGAAIDGATPVGYDCATDSTTMYALSADQPIGRRAQSAGTQGVVGVLDPATGEFTETAPLSDPEAFVDALAVAPAEAPITPTTPTDRHSPATGRAGHCGDPGVHGLTCRLRGLPDPDHADSYP